MEELAELIEAEVREGGAELEVDLLGSGDAARWAEHIESWAGGALGPVAGATFYTRSVGLTIGLVAGGRHVVVKLRRWNTSLPRLAAQQDVQRIALRRGLAAPEPLAGPEVMGRGLVTAESLLPRGDPVGSPQELRRGMASTLARFVHEASSSPTRSDLGRAMVVDTERSNLWPDPHDLRFDFNQPDPGAMWIDSAASRARAVLSASDEDLAVGHLDWRVENLGWIDSEIVGIFDWDSVALAPEPVIVGCAAASFTTDWRRLPHHVPTAQEARAFVADYQDVGDREFTDHEMELAGAAELWTVSYGARCQNSDVLRGLASSEGPLVWIEALRERLGEEGLAGMPRRAGS